MDIDITDLTAHEIQSILSNYPRGKLEIKHDRIFWDSPNFEPVPRSPTEAAMQPPRQPTPQQPTIGDRFARMADTLGSMVC